MTKLGSEMSRFIKQLFQRADVNCINIQTEIKTILNSNYLCIHYILLIHCFALFPVCTSLKIFIIYYLELSGGDNENKY